MPLFFSDFLLSSLLSSLPSPQDSYLILRSWYLSGFSSHLSHDLLILLALSGPSQNLSSFSDHLYVDHSLTGTSRPHAYAWHP